VPQPAPCLTPYGSGRHRIVAPRGGLRTPRSGVRLEDHVPVRRPRHRGDETRRAGMNMPMNNLRDAPRAELAWPLPAGIGVPITMAGTVGYIRAGLPREAALPAVPRFTARA
jgi:hypothetical protein